MPSRHHGAQRAGKAPTQRQLRIGEEIRHALAALFQRGDFHDPELQSLNVTVTEVRISPDLRNATAFVTPLGGGNVGETVAALKRAAPFLRGQIARAINLRYAPTLGFEPDTSFDYADRIGRVLHTPEVARDLEDDDPEDDDPEDDDTGARDEDKDDGPGSEDDGDRRGA